MKQVDWQDERGRKYRVLLPDGADESEAALGVPVGPPPLADNLALPDEIATRLHNELHARGLWGLREAARDPRALQGALQAALRVDIQTLLEGYAAWERAESADPEGEAARPKRPRAKEANKP